MSLTVLLACIINFYFFIFHPKNKMAHNVKIPKKQGKYHKTAYIDLTIMQNICGIHPLPLVCVSFHKLKQNAKMLHSLLFSSTTGISFLLLKTIAGLLAWMDPFIPLTKLLLNPKLNLVAYCLSLFFFLMFARKKSNSAFETYGLGNSWRQTKIL